MRSIMTIPSRFPRFTKLETLRSKSFQIKKKVSKELRAINIFCGFKEPTKWVNVALVASFDANLKHKNEIAANIAKVNLIRQLELFLMSFGAA